VQDLISQKRSKDQDADEHPFSLEDSFLGGNSQVPLKQTRDLKRIMIMSKQTKDMQTDEICGWDQHLESFSRNILTLQAKAKTTKISRI
jgi:hypothetical protein